MKYIILILLGMSCANNTDKLALVKKTINSCISKREYIEYINNSDIEPTNVCDISTTFGACECSDATFKSLLRKIE